MKAARSSLVAPMFARASAWVRMVPSGGLPARSYSITLARTWPMRDILTVGVVEAKLSSRTLTLRMPSRSTRSLIRLLHPLLALVARAS